MTQQKAGKEKPGKNLGSTDGASLATTARAMQLKVGRASSLPHADQGFRTDRRPDPSTRSSSMQETSSGRQDALPYPTAADPWPRSDRVVPARERLQTSSGAAEDRACRSSGAWRTWRPPNPQLTQWATTCRISGVQNRVRRHAIGWRWSWPGLLQS